MKFLSKKLSAIGFNCRIIKSKGTGLIALNLYARLGRKTSRELFGTHRCWRTLKIGCTTV